MTSSMKAMKAASASVATGAGLRVRPFTAAVVPPSKAASRSSVRARAAATEEDLDFSFSFSDARRNNEYTASEVEAALAYFQDGAGSHPAYDADFVTNTFGTEDASFFDDVDNDEGYNDEYVVAGIPEAAPKKRGRNRNEASAQEDSDDVEQAKALDKVKALEDRMVLEAAIEEEFGDATRGDGASTASDGKAVWEWLTDLSSTDAQGLEAPRKAATTSAGAALTDSQVNSDIALAKPELFEDTQVPTYLELFAADDVTEEVLAAAGESDDASGVAGSSITDADLARVDALLAQELPTLDLSALGTLPAGSAAVPRLDDGMAELSSEVVDQYIAQLRAVGVRGAGAPEAEVKAAVGDEPLTLEAAEPALDEAARKEYNQLLAAAEPQLGALAFDLDAQAAAVEDVSGEPAEDEDAGLERELRQLAAFDPLTEESLPDEAALEGLEGYLVAAEDFVAQEEARKASIAAAVARGELSADVLSEELEDLPDAEDEVVRAYALAADEELDNPALDMSQFEEDDGETWVERIIELTRVTKVVKGGKIMGFRCVAIVGNQNGLVGVGCQAGREVAVAVKRTLVDARRNVVRVPLVGAGTVPHRSEAKFHAARCVVLPASDGTGCIAGGSVRSVLELAGVKNCLAKRLGSRSALNSARATVRALQQMQSLPEVAKARGLPMEQLLLPQ